MTTGKRRANWEKVLEAQMQPVHSASMAMQAQITDLKAEVKAIKTDAVRERHWILVTIIVAGTALVMVIAK